MKWPSQWTRLPPLLEIVGPGPSGFEPLILCLNQIKVRTFLPSQIAELSNIICPGKSGDAKCVAEEAVDRFQIRNGFAEYGVIGGVDGSFVF